MNREIEDGLILNEIQTCFEYEHIVLRDKGWNDGIVEFDVFFIERRGVNIVKELSWGVEEDLFDKRGVLVLVNLFEKRWFGDDFDDKTSKMVPKLNGCIFDGFFILSIFLQTCWLR